MVNVLQGYLDYRCMKEDETKEEAPLSGADG